MNNNSEKQQKTLFKLRTNSKDFKDVSHQIIRTYHFTGNEKVTVDEPVYLKDNSDTHVVIDSDQVVHEINPGWFKVSYTVKDNQLHYKEG